MRPVDGSLVIGRKHSQSRVVTRTPSVSAGTSIAASASGIGLGADSAHSTKLPTSRIGTRSNAHHQRRNRGISLSGYGTLSNLRALRSRIPSHVTVVGRNAIAFYAITARLSGVEVNHDRRLVEGRMSCEEVTIAEAECLQYQLHLTPKDGETHPRRTER
jgi:hypothetical protein